MSVKTVFTSKYAFHFLLWIFFVFSLYADTNTMYIGKGLLTIYILTKTIIQAALVYINNLVLFPVFFKRKYYFLYFWLALIITLLAGYANMRLEIAVINDGIELSNERHFQFFLSQLGMAARYILISFLLIISVDYYEQKETIKKIALEKATAELNFLKAQVNPHFLFNVLNSLYALILEKSDKSAEVVLKLADIMKYLLAESKEDKVMLQKELDLLRNYTELERLRKPDAEVIFSVSGNFAGAMITPLLLLPLVENAFKYGLNSVAKNGFVRINIVSTGRQLDISIENNVPPVKNNAALQSMGIGIENVRKRLDMLYAGKYKLNMENKEGVFFVNLQLQLS